MTLSLARRVVRNCSTVTGRLPSRSATALKKSMNPITNHHSPITSPSLLWQRFAQRFVKSENTREK